MKSSKISAVFCAVLAALFYALNTPLSKILMVQIPVTLMAACLYLGAGFGVGLLYLFHYKKEAPSERLTRQDLPYTLAMIALDIAAPLFMMLGIKLGTASHASLLGNFEIVATTLIALLFFREAVSKRLWTAIGLITLSSLLLSLDGSSSLSFSRGSLFVILANVCWGLENNCTRRIADKSTYQIVVLKGIFSGLGSLLIGLFRGEALPGILWIIAAMALGFVAYGLSIFTYIRAQRTLGAAKTSAFYALAPFIGALLAFLLLKEPLSAQYGAALIIMVAGTLFVIQDTFSDRQTR